MTTRFALADYQTDAVEALTGVIHKVARLHEQEPESRRQIALEQGVTLLQSPTGSGKTLLLGRTLEALRGSLGRPVVWLWFAPFAGLVSQTRDALGEQASSLRLRDISSDREAVGSRDGDVFVQTWATVAANNANARKVRRELEDKLSIDQLIAEWRSRGFFVVIDEAHLNFGANAGAAANFYLDTLRPDFTILATATPNDDKLQAFEKKAGIEVASRVIIPREDVVEAGLNKLGLKLGVLQFRPGDEALIDHEQATLTAAWVQHEKVKERLVERDLTLTPLLLVQVENQEKGGNEPTERVRAKLLEAGVPAKAIATHTSGEPDPHFHTLAYDPDIEVLIFKVAVATGFDAPRAWSLVSVRPNRGKDFGMQIVGRIMRVHPLVRPGHGEDPLLDHGYVFLTDPTMQVGLQSAVDEIKAVQRSMELITDRLDFVEIAPVPPVEAHDPPADFLPAKPKTDGERKERLEQLVMSGFVHDSVRDMSPEVQDEAIQKGESYANAVQTPLFTGLPEAPTPTPDQSPVNPALKPYKLRSDLGLPKALWRELPPDPMKINDMIEDIAQAFCKRADVRSYLLRRKAKAHLSFEDLFREVASEESQAEAGEDFSVLLSNAKIAERAQMAFRFNDAIDTGQLKKAIAQHLNSICLDEGLDVTTQDVRRAIDLAAMLQPAALTEAIKDANARNTQLDASAEIPHQFFGPDGLPPANRASHGVYPHKMNKEERAFAELLDRDNTGVVKWWLRNPENETWATRLVLPSGKRFFPDFVVGVAGRTSRDEIALIEIKDDGSTGRLQSDNNLEKIRVQHREYKNVFWSYRSGRDWVRAEYEGSLHRIVERKRFEIEEIVFLS
jgi:superfamily II DNA or RNA helicase